MPFEKARMKQNTCQNGQTEIMPKRERQREREKEKHNKTKITPTTITPNPTYKHTRAY